MKRFIEKNAQIFSVISVFLALGIVVTFMLQLFSETKVLINLLLPLKFWGVYIVTTTIYFLIIMMLAMEFLSEYKSWKWIKLSLLYVGIYFATITAIKLMIPPIPSFLISVGGIIFFFMLFKSSMDSDRSKFQKQTSLLNLVKALKSIGGYIGKNYDEKNAEMVLLFKTDMIARIERNKIALTNFYYEEIAPELTLDSMKDIVRVEPEEVLDRNKDIIENIFKKIESHLKNKSLLS